MQSGSIDYLGERRYDLDWVRIGAFMLLIFYHVGMYYVTWDWHVKSPHASHTLEPLMLLTSPWRLPLLFLVSGVATAYLLERQGPKGFLGKRSLRLLLPLLFAMAVIVPPQPYLEVVEKLAYPGSYRDFLRLYFAGYHGFCRDGECLRLPTWNHLWFVAYLWLYTAILYALVRVLPSSVRWLRQLADRALTGVGTLLWPVLLFALARIALYPYYPQNHAIVGDWYNHALYGTVFLLGFALAGAPAPWRTIERVRWLALGCATLGWVFLATGLALYTANPATVPAVIKLGYSSVYAAEQWVAIVAVLGFARRHLVRDSAARRYLTSAVFPIYILHQTVIVVLAHTLQPADLHPAVEATLLILAAISACFMGYEVIRRIKPLRPLFGLPLRVAAASTAGPRRPSDDRAQAAGAQPAGVVPSSLPSAAAVSSPALAIPHDVQ